ncbi:MAG: hypothetical protein U5N55_12755 [Cypionkella sp.]|nr:hypothetical protein [Cypionkella sp.]
MAKLGRKPYQWTSEVEQEIFDRISKGASVRSILVDDWLPCANVFYDRLAVDPDFTKRYLRAREAQADTIFEECLAIADSQEGDVVMRDGVEMVNHDNIARAKLRIDTRMRMAGKLRPKVYGDKLDLDHKSSDGSMTPVFQTVIDRRKGCSLCLRVLGSFWVSVFGSCVFLVPPFFLT